MLVVFYIAQSVPSLGLQFMNVSPELLLVLSVCVAFNESETFSAFFAFAAGVLNDCITDSVVGKSAIFFMFAAYFISVALRTVLRKQFLTYVFMCLSALALFLIIEYLLVLVFYGGMPLGLSLMKIILPKFFYSGVLSYPAYFVVRFLAKKLDAGGDTL
jgi:rod shape-determining protein MreD